MRRWMLILGLFLLAVLPIRAQDGLNLPTELYILLNEGRVERYGLGLAGVQSVSAASAFVLDFGVAPDGNWLAYRTPDGLFISNMFTIEQRQIENARASIPPVRGRGSTIAWSPGSDALAYTTEYGARVAFLESDTFADITTPGLFHLLWSPDGGYLAGEAPEGVWWIFRRQGAEMMLTAALPGAQGADWISPSQIIYAPLEGGVTIIELNAGNQPTVILEGPTLYHLPHVLPDGSVRVFSGETTAARLVEIVGTVEGNAATPIGVGDVDLTDVRWAPQGQLLIAFQGGALAVIDPNSGAGFTLPIAGAAAYGWGPTYPLPQAGVTLPADGYFIALDNNLIAQVWWLPADGSLPATITPAAHDITEFALSPDKSRIAYVSNSSLWAFALGTQAPPVELVKLGISEDVTPSWAPDNETVYYRDTQEIGGGIWRLTVGLTEPERFLGNTDSIIFTNPVLATGVAAMVVTVNNELTLIDTTSGAEDALGVSGQAEWLSGTQLLAEGSALRGTFSGSGLFVLDAGTPEADPVLIMPIDDKLRLLDYRALSNNTIRVVVQNNTPGRVQILELRTDGTPPAFVSDAGYMNNPQLAPDGSVVIGSTYPGGALIVYHIATRTRTLIDGLPQVNSFVWE